MGLPKPRMIGPGPARGTVLVDDSLSVTLGLSFPKRQTTRGKPPRLPLRRIPRVSIAQGFGREKLVESRARNPKTPKGPLSLPCHQEASSPSLRFYHRSDC